MDKPYGIIGTFETPKAVYEAAKKVRKAGYTRWDVIAPFPIHGIEKAMGERRSLVGAFTLVGGVIGFFSGMAIAWWMGLVDYPLIVAGMPYFSPIFPFPVAYELTILLAAFGTLFGMFFLNRLPMHYHPVMHASNFDRLTNDTFAIVIESTDPQYSDAETTNLLRENGANDIEVLPL